MKTELFKTVVTLKLSESEALDIAQEAGAISDLCLKLIDVADSDCPRAIDALLAHTRFEKMKGKR